MGRATKKRVSDTEIRTRVRAAIARHRLDPQRVAVRIAGGTVRVGGRLAFVGGRDSDLPLAVVEAFERELAGASGVRQLYFELADWRRSGPGEWTHVAKPKGSGPVPVREPEVGAPVPAAGAV